MTTQADVVYGDLKAITNPFLEEEIDIRKVFNGTWTSMEYRSERRVVFHNAYDNSSKGSSMEWLWLADSTWTRVFLTSTMRTHLTALEMPAMFFCTMIELGASLPSLELMTIQVHHTSPVPKLAPQFGLRVPKIKEITFVTKTYTPPLDGVDEQTARDSGTHFDKWVRKHGGTMLASCYRLNRMETLRLWPDDTKAIYASEAEYRRLFLPTSGWTLTRDSGGYCVQRESPEVAQSS